MAIIDTDIQGQILWITLNRPESLNALTGEMHQGLQDIFDAYAASPDQRVCVITGAGDKAFCAGSDLKDGLSDSYPAGGYAGLSDRFDLNKPVIAMVNGFTLGGGFELALSCDLIIASDTASFGLPEPLVGAVALGGGMHRLPRQIGLKNAMGLLLTSRRVSADEGYRMGFVNEVVAASELRTTTERWCADILKGSPISIETTKAVAMKGLDEPDLASALKAQSDYESFKRWQQAEDTMEGINAFVEKRKPNWKGR